MSIASKTGTRCRIVFADLIREIDRVAVCENEVDFRVGDTERFDGILHGGPLSDRVLERHVSLARTSFCPR